MADREKVIKGLEEAETMLAQAVDRGGEMSVIGAFYCLNRVTDALALLKEQQEIVLCKDCKYGEHMCKPWSDIICNQNRATHIQDWFCADGKRREQSELER